MKRKIVLGMSLVLMFTACLTGCQTNSGKKQETPVTERVSMDDGTDDMVKPKKTEYKLTENGRSEYQIVIPSEPTDRIKEAAEEMQYFLQEATGIKLPIVKDTELKTLNHLISLGRTTVAAKVGVKTTKADDLKTSGYRIKTAESNLVILDDIEGDGEGVLYGVYDFLEDAIDLSIYTMDEISMSHEDTVWLYEYDDYVRPSFDERSLSYYDVRSDETYMHRMRMFDFYTTDEWALYGHSQVSKILPYTPEHEDWYCAGGGQLCWSAGDEMETAFADSLIEHIKNNPEAVYFMLGQEDATKVCNCEKCQKNISSDKYGSYSGLQIAFLNHVIKKVETWRKKNAPDRELRYVCFAYQFSAIPPVKEDSDGNITAYHKDCIPADELYILFTPIEADYSQTLEESTNRKFSDAVKNWQIIAPGRLLVYEYDCNFSNYLLNFNNFDVVQKHYQLYAENGVSLMYSQGPVEVRIPCFSEMRIYVESRLMWDINQNYDQLVNRFMKAYYKDAAEAMRGYYDEMKKIYAEYEAGGTGQIYASIDDVYTMDNLEKLDGHIRAALQAIEPLRKSDNDMYSTLYYRIKKEYVSSLWLKLSKFNLYYSEEELNDFTLEFYYLCDRYGIESYAEGKDIDDMFYGNLLEE